MRWLISGILFVSGAVLLFLLSAGAFSSADWLTPPADPWESALSPLWKLGRNGALALTAGTTSVLLGAGVLFWSTSDQRSRPGAWRWSSILQAALCLNVFVGAILILATSFSMRAGATGSTVGHLFALAALTTLVGSFLAFASIGRVRSTPIFATTTSLHLLEACTLGVVIMNGFGG